jgi:hypothetical protein
MREGKGNALVKRPIYVGISLRERLDGQGNRGNHEVMRLVNACYGGQCTGEGGRISASAFGVFN